MGTKAMTRLRQTLLLALPLLAALAVACTGAPTGDPEAVSPGDGETVSSPVGGGGDQASAAGAGADPRGRDAERPTARASEAQPFAPIVSLKDQYPEYQDESSGLRTILGTPDLGVGGQRVAFVLTNRSGIIKIPVAKVETFFHPDGGGGPQQGPVETQNARYYDFPLGVRGIYVAHLTFDRPGLWGLRVSIPTPDGKRVDMRFNFQVDRRTEAVQVGDEVPETRNRTLADVASVAQLTTSGDPDPQLYDEQIAELKAAGRPFVVTFASPAFCTNALCGPQVEVLSHLRARYSDQASFVHVDLYENPHEIKGNLSNAVRTPILEEWGLETDEWTFIVDPSGRVASKFESFAPEGELETALLEMLETRTPGTAS